MSPENETPIPETAEIIDLGDGGMLGLCPSGEKRWLKGPAVPGDTVRFLREGRGGRILEIITPAPNRIPAPCPHFGTCPGCQLQPLPLSAQTEWKARKIQEALRRIGGFKSFVFDGVHPSPEPYGTRNKLDLHLRGSEIGYTNGWELLPVTDCLLGADPLRTVLQALRPCFDAPHGLHRMMLRTNTDRNQVLVLVRGDPLPPDLLATCQAHPLITGLAQQPEKTAEWHSLYGRTHLNMQLADHPHEIAHDAFFQVHDTQADALVRTAMDWLSRCHPQSVLDLFSGAGAFTFPAARIAPTVLGLDTRPGQGPFLQADLQKGLPQDKRLKSNAWDVVLTDPPRDGMEKRLCRQIRDQIQPRHVLYISCNPATLARDLARLAHDRTYTLLRVQGFDLFPQTTHVETLAWMERSKS